MTVHDFAAIAREIKASRAMCGDVHVIAIDGPAGSGKTTLAAGLVPELNNCPVIHLDDVYDGWLQDFDQELGQRLRREVLEPLQQGAPGKYAKYNWYTKSFDSFVKVPKGDYLILEGVGSNNLVITELLAYSIWIEANADVLIDRIISRDGESMRPHLAGFKRREADYFEKHNVKARADLQLSGD